jgi:hypothetical protein
VTRKITRAVAAISKGQQEKLYLGNLEAIRDYVENGDQPVDVLGNTLEVDFGDYGDREVRDYNDYNQTYSLVDDES